MIVTNYLKNHNLDDLKNNFGIDYHQYSDRIILNYGMISSAKNKFNPIVIECRGLILDNSLNVLHRAFDRFFNYSEDPKSNEFDISRAICLEKLDGSLIGFYYDGKNWNFSTRGMAFAEGLINPDTGETFNQFINSNFKNEINYLKNNCNPNNSYIFELTSPENRVVTRYLDRRLNLLAIRNKKTGEYISNELNDWKWKPKQYTFKNFNDIINSMKNLPEDSEGYVCNLGEWRIKIKNPSYLAIHNLRTNGPIHEKYIINLVHNRDEAEYLGSFPEDYEKFKPYIYIRDNIESYYINIYNKYKNIETQKDFAIAISKIPLNGILFALRQNKSIQHYLESTTSSYIQKIYTTLKGKEL